MDAASKSRAQQPEDIEAVMNEGLEVDPEAGLCHEEVSTAEATVRLVDARLVLENSPEGRIVLHETKIEDPTPLRSTAMHLEACTSTQSRAEGLMPYDDSCLDEDNLQTHSKMFHSVEKLYVVSYSLL